MTPGQARDSYRYVEYPLLTVLLRRILLHLTATVPIVFQAALIDSLEEVRERNLDIVIDIDIIMRYARAFEL